MCVQKSVTIYDPKGSHPAEAYIVSHVGVYRVHSMMKVRATSAWSTCWTYDPLLLFNSLRMAPGCQNMYKLAPNMKCVLCYMCFCTLISGFCWLKYRLEVNAW